MCRTADTTTPGRKSLRCPACSSGNKNRAYQKARYAAQKALKASETTTPHNEESNAAEGHTETLRDFEEVKSEARELSSQMQEAFSSPVTEERARAMGYESIDSMYADFETRSTAIGKQVGLHAERDIDFHLPENMSQQIDDFREQRAQEIKDKYPETSHIHQVGADLKRERGTVQTDRSIKKHLVENEGYTQYDAEHEVRTYMKDFNKFSAELGGVSHALPPELDERLEGLSQAYMSRLKEVREFGGNVEGTYKAAVHGKYMTEIAEVYPSSWIQASNDYPLPMTVKLTQGQGAHYVAVAKQKKTGHEPRAKRYYKVTDGKVLTASARGKILFPGNPAESYIHGGGDPHAEVVSGVYAAEHSNPKDKKPTELPSEMGNDRRLVRDSSEDWEWREYSVVASDGSLESKEGWVNVETSIRRKSYVDSYAAELTMGKDHRGLRNLSVYHNAGQHELAHRMEVTVPGISEMEAKFRERRELNEDGTQESTQFIDSRGQDRGRRDNYTHAYVGKEYPPEDDVYGRTVKSTEVLSVGMEAIFSRSYGSLVGADKGSNEDKDHRSFVLGLLATR